MEHEIEAWPFLLKAGGDLCVCRFTGAEISHLWRCYVMEVVPLSQSRL